MDEDIRPIPLFKGACRVPTLLGVPTMPLLAALSFVAILAMWTSLWCWLLAGPIIVVMRLITRHDDRAFFLWGLWFESQGRNRHKVFWRASSYAPARYRRRGRHA